MEHSGHDVVELLSRWDAFGETTGWERVELGRPGDYPVFALLNEKARQQKDGGLYISAGVHGDECAPPWALLRWTESNPDILREHPVVMIPCFNPVGLLENRRTNGEGVDLNRNFQNKRIPLVSAWHGFLDGRRFSMALNLHEDYDASGIYLYEIADDAPQGDSFLAACQDIIPRETADSVDGSEFKNGLLSHEPDREDILRIVEEDLSGGMPEAICLYLNYTRNSYTFETPSELDLDRRITAHSRFLEVASAHFRQSDA